MYSLIFKYPNQPRDKAGRFSSGWEKVGHNLGSNAGGVHEFEGKKFYVKYPKNPEQVHAEVASDKIHELMGCHTIQHEAKIVNGAVASVTPWNDTLKPLGRAGWEHLDDKQKQQAVNTFMASALTKNWDLVGLAHDNIAKDSQGDLHIVDTGGSFNFRAMGDHKDFDGDANPEITNFFNPEKTSGRVFRPMAKENPEMFRKAARHLATLTRGDFEKAIGASKMKDQKKVVDTLMERQKSILNRFGIK